MASVKTSDLDSSKPGPGINKQYSWEPEDEFILKGEEFSAILNVLRMAATEKGGAPAIALVEAHGIIERLMIAGVHSGVIKEKAEAVGNPIARTLGTVV